MVRCIVWWCGGRVALTGALGVAPVESVSANCSLINIWLTLATAIIIIKIIIGSTVRNLNTQALRSGQVPDLVF